MATVDLEDDDLYKRIKDDNKIQRPPKRQYHYESNNCCIQSIINIFLYFWPAQEKPVNTIEGLWLKNWLHCATLCHMFFFIFSLTVVGFISTTINVGLLMLSYSCYLTIRDCTIIFYEFFLMSAIFVALLYGLS